MLKHSNNITPYPKNVNHPRYTTWIPLYCTRGRNWIADKCKTNLKQALLTWYNQNPKKEGIKNKIKYQQWMENLSKIMNYQFNSQTKIHCTYQHRIHFWNNSKFITHFLLTPDVKEVNSKGKHTLAKQDHIHINNCPS